MVGKTKSTLDRGVKKRFAKMFRGGLFRDYFELVAQVIEITPNRR